MPPNPLLSGLRASDDDFPLAEPAPVVTDIPVMPKAAVQAPVTVAPTAPASINQHPLTPAPPQDTPPLYSFELPEETPAPRTTRVTEPYREEHEPRLGDWQTPVTPKPEPSPFDFSAAQRDSDDVIGSTGFSAREVVRPAAAAAAAATAGVVNNTFMPAFTATSDASSQIKQGIGPELPRPNPVRIPTRRELASYGIKLPSQRIAEQEQRNRGDEPQPEPVSNPQEEDEALQEAALRQAFAEQQSQRYGEEYQQEEYQQDDEDAQREAELGQAFAAQQQARYGVEEPQPDPEPAPVTRPVDTRQAYSFSPMADLVDDGPTEPLFTLSPQLEDSIEQESELEDDVPFGQFEPEVPAYQVPRPQTNPAPGYQPQQTYQPPVQQQPPAPAMDSLIHPFLMRNDMPLQKPTTPLPTLDLLTEAPKRSSRSIPSRWNRKRGWWKPAWRITASRPTWSIFCLARSLPASNWIWLLASRPRVSPTCRAIWPVHCQLPPCVWWR